MFATDLCVENLFSTIAMTLFDALKSDKAKQSERNYSILFGMKIKNISS